MWTWKRSAEYDLLNNQYVTPPPRQLLPTPTGVGHGYSVGYTDDGGTVLTLSAGDNSITCTMQDDSVRKLIRLLETTVRKKRCQV